MCFIVGQTESSQLSMSACVASYGRPTDLFYLELSAPKGKTACVLEGEAADKRNEAGGY